MIPQIKELNLPAYATLSSATVNLSDMGENTITTEVKIDGGIAPDFSYDWEIEFRGDIYIHTLRKPQAYKDNTSIESVSSLTFKLKPIVELQRYYFFTYAATNSGTAVADQYIAPLSLNLKNFCIAFNEVLDYYFHGSIVIDLNPDWVYDPEPTTMDISYSYLWDVLVKLYELYKVRWRIVRDGERYIIKVGYPVEELDHIFQYGFQGGLLKTERNVQDDKIRNIILGRGGSKNLPQYYFKKAPDNSTFPSDPDWIPELANVYFDSLRDSNFRDYVKGWKTNPNRDLLDGTLTLDTYDPNYAADHFAYELGATDEFFRPVEYVKDDASIQQYGELWGAKDNNEDIYPSIQGVTVDPIGRVDEVIAVQPITSDDVETAVEGEAQLSDLEEKTVTVIAAASQRAAFTINGSAFTIPDGLHGVLLVEPQVQRIVQRFGRVSGKVLSGDDVAGLAIVENYTVKVFDKDTNAEVSAANIPQGEYYYTVEGTVVNNDSVTLNITVGVSNGNVISSSKGQEWGNTFDIWIKNVWLTTKLPGETDEQYVNRVWVPILGGRDGEEAKVVFSTGWLSTSEDYEFTIVKGGVHFEQKQCTWTDGEGVEHSYTSEWRLTLAKSDAELDATGLYLPNTRINAEAGDFFFFIGIELPHQYVLWGEQRVNEYKQVEVEEVSDIKPTWGVDLDKVRIAEKKISPDEVTSLIEQIVPGASFRLADPRFITDKAYETVYVQSMTFEFKEPTDSDPALIPDLSIVLSNEWAVTATLVGPLEGSINALTKQVGSLSNIEQMVRVIGDKLYLRKDGISDLSLSPTQFASLVTSLNFRQGLLGGQGWGFFKDEQDNWSLEVDRLNVRQQMQVNELVVNQISARGGMYIESAASMEVTDVVNSTDGYVCYFDQKSGTVANLFREDDVVLCLRMDEENIRSKFYKRRVVATGVDHIVLSESERNGDGIPEKGDVIVQYGSYTEPTRRYVKVRDVVGGGYERYLEGLDSVNATGTEYYFVGRQSGSYGNNPRFFIGNTQRFIEFINGDLNIKAKINAQSTIGDKPINEYITDIASQYAQTILAQYSATGGESDSEWHPNFQDGDVWMRTSTDGGETWTPAMRIVGQDGQYRKFQWAKNTHTDIPPGSGWQDTPMTADPGEYVWMRSGIVQPPATAPTKWDKATRLTGDKGASGESVYTLDLSNEMMPMACDAEGVVLSSYMTSQATVYKGGSAVPASEVTYSIAQVSGVSATIDATGLITPSALTADRGTIIVQAVVSGVTLQTTLSLYKVKPGENGEDAVIYTLDLSANNITRNAIGQLSTNTITVKKYKTTGASARELTTEKSIRYQFMGLNVLPTTILAGTNSYDISVPDDKALTAIVVELLSGTAVLDRERIPIVSDLTALTEPTINLVKYSDVNINTSDYFVAQFKLSEDLVVGDAYTFTIWGKPGLGRSFRIYDSLSTSLIASLTELVPGIYSAVATIGSEMESRNKQYIRVYQYPPTVASAATLERIKVEKGNNPVPVWTASPEDDRYLRQALQESTTIEGGLILSTLMQLGYTASDGNYKVTSGINGVAEPSSAIAVWTGGRMIDRAESSAIDAAMAVLRHDGTAYFAGNTVRFGPKFMQVGDNLQLDENGLSLLTDDGTALSIGDVAVSDVGVAGAFNQALSGQLFTSEVMLYKDTATGIVYPVGEGTYVPTQAAAPAGTVITAHGEITWDPQIDEVSLSPQFFVDIIVGNVVIETRSYIPAKIGSTYKSNFDISNIRTVQQGVVKLRLRLQTEIQSSWVEYEGNPYNPARLNFTSGSLTYNTNNQTTLGNNGILAVWGNSVLLCNNSMVMMKYGTYGLRITDNGIEKLVNGIWQTANL